MWVRWHPLAWQGFFKVGWLGASGKQTPVIAPAWNDHIESTNDDLVTGMALSPDVRVNTVGVLQFHDGPAVACGARRGAVP